VSGLIPGLPPVCPISELCLGGPSGVATGVAKAAAGDILAAVSSALSDAATWLVGHVIDLVNTTTKVNLDGSWFTGEVAAMRNVVLLVVLPVLMAGSIGAILRQDPRRLLRVWGVGLPVSVLAGLAGVQFADLALGATDRMCEVIIGGSTQQFAKQFSTVMISGPVSKAPLFVQMILSILLIAGTVLVWLELVVRAAAVYVAMFFMPLALVGYIWPATAGMAKRGIEILVALILSKFVIVATLTLGLAALAPGSPADAAIAGAAILLIAGFAPFCLLRLAPIVETAAIGHLEGLSRRPLRAASHAATAVAAAPTHPVAKLLLAGGGGSSTPLSPAAVVSQAIPQRRPDYPASTDPGSTGA
jgi:hypothetical protein